MSAPYVGEIRMAGFNFPPAGWAVCNGATVPISENDTLFNLIGTTYGGDGQTTFNLPDLQGRIPLHMGTGPGSTYNIGQLAGTETVTLTTNQIPQHNHSLEASTAAATQAGPGGNIAAQTSQNLYITPTAPVALSASSTLTGGNQPHDNLMQFLVINFIISLFGVYPSPT